MAVEGLSWHHRVMYGGSLLEQDLLLGRTGQDAEQLQAMGQGCIFTKQNSKQVPALHPDLRPGSPTYQLNNFRKFAPILSGSVALSLKWG